MKTFLTKLLSANFYPVGAILTLLVIILGYSFLLTPPDSATPIGIGGLNTHLEPKDSDPLDPMGKTTTPIVATKTPVRPAKKTLEIMAWIYPGEPGCSAPAEYRDGRQIDVLKPEYYRVGEGGVLEFLTEDTAGCNGYSPANVLDVAKYSNRQFVTVASAYAVDMGLFLDQALADKKAITTLVNFTIDNHFEGVELDFEDYGGWTNEHYDAYKKFVRVLGDELHQNGKELMIVGPATAGAEQEAWFRWRYNDFVPLPVDTIIIMAYDYQFDHGAGHPIAPFDWTTGAIDWALAKFPDQSRLGIGLPSYGYSGQAGSQSLKLLTQEQIASQINPTLAKRDTSSGELKYSANGTDYFFQDSQSLDAKYDHIRDYGLSAVSIWSLGGNPWFSR